MVWLLIFLNLSWAQETPPANLLKPLISEKVIQSVDVSGTNSYKTSHRACKWKQVTANNARLDALILRDCEVIRSSFHKSHLRNLTSLQTNWSEVNFQDADLRGSYWSRSSCLNCDFRGADLTDATFVLMNFKGSKINAKTKLPFDAAEAKLRGLIDAP